MCKKKQKQSVNSGLLCELAPSLPSLPSKFFKTFNRKDRRGFAKATKGLVWGANIPAKGLPDSLASPRISRRYLDRTGVQTIVQSLHAQSLNIVLHGRADSRSSHLAYSRSQRSSLPNGISCPFNLRGYPVPSKFSWWA